MEQQVNPTSVVVRFPDGSREFRFPKDPLKEGDVIWHDGQDYCVIHVSQTDGAGPTILVEPRTNGVGDLLRSEEGSIRLEPAA